MKYTVNWSLIAALLALLANLAVLARLHGVAILFASVSLVASSLFIADCLVERAHRRERERGIHE